MFQILVNLPMLNYEIQYTNKNEDAILLGIANCIRYSMNMRLWKSKDDNKMTESVYY